MKKFSLFDRVFRPGKVIKFLREENARLRHENRSLRRRSELDVVTGGRNRLGLTQDATLALQTLARQQSAMDIISPSLLPPLSFVVSILFIDLDHFKEWNDAEGHAAGDEALKMVLKLIGSQFLDGSGLVGRWGGDEFVVILPCVDQVVAFEKAGSLRELIEDWFKYNGRITTSIGVSACLFSSDENPKSFLKRLIGTGDSAMYKAKKAGKNQVYRILCADSSDRRQ